MTDARARLVEAAAELVHADGYHRTSLARIAERAEVPLGNVYYYFPTKAAIVDAVLERLSDGQATLRRRWERHVDPRERLAAFAMMPKRDRRVLARSGCPMGSLGTELGKGGGPTAAGVGGLLAGWLDWLEAQFAAIGRPDPAGDARHLLAALQGASLLSHVLGNPQLVAAEADRMAAWVRSL